MKCNFRLVKVKQLSLSLQKIYVNSLNIHNNYMDGIEIGYLYESTGDIYI